MIQYSKIRPLLPLLFWLWLISILILMVIPTNVGSLYDFPGKDKLIHFGLFAILGFFFIAPRFKNETQFRISKENWSTYILLLFSLSVEFIQLLLDYRSFEFMDSLMNGLGVVSGIALGRLLMLRIFKG